MSKIVQYISNIFAFLSTSFGKSFSLQSLNFYPQAALRQLPAFIWTQARYTENLEILLKLILTTGVKVGEIWLRTTG